MSPLDGESAQELMDIADTEMYREKETARRGRLVPPDSERTAPNAANGTHGTRDSAIAPSSTSGSSSREARLRAALEADEFEVHFQPIVDTISGRVVAAEALLRWRDPDGGLLLPDSFLPLAEDTGLIVPIGERALRAACESVVEWRALGAAGDIRMSVNLSAVQLRDHGFDRRVAAILSETGCPPESIVLELSENSTMVDGEVAIETLRALKALGLRLLVDDFGVGFASLTFLRQAPLDGIKIDRRFIAQMLLDQRDLAIVASLVQLARGLGLDVIAEGVESAEQSHRLTRLQCFTQQGRHFSDAVPPTAMARMLFQRPIPASDGSLWSPRMLVANGG
jgi:EAL domain-containing protein (putative c-di-GMP-specific phosphodiesterase class I)